MIEICYQGIYLNIELIDEVAGFPNEFSLHYETDFFNISSLCRFLGLEAVIDDLKNGRVTLRRRRVQQKVPISPKENYTNIYELLEKNQQQNRSSRKILDTELTKVFRKFNVNF